jgi:hypothetical protein
MKGGAMPQRQQTRTLAAGVLLASAALISSGCAARTTRGLNPIADAYASGSAYIYEPLNPTTIWIRDPCRLGVGETRADITSPDFKRALLRDLDTETVRVSLSHVDANGSVATPIVGESNKGESYVLVIDYIKYFTSDEHVNVDYEDAGRAGAATKTIHVVPIYAGIGVRIRAEFKALASNVNISGLPALGVAADARQVSGRLTVQTLGITGPDITALMPLLSDLSVGSIQSAVQAVAAIKAKLYEDSSVAYPKIVGFESPTPNTDAITRITEYLYGTEEAIVPRVSPNPTNRDQALLWIQWFPTRDEWTCPTPAQAAAR